MKKIIFGLFTLHFLLCTFSYSYDKIQFQGQITNPSLVKPSAIAVSDDLLFIADSKLNTVFIFDKDQNLVAKTSFQLKFPGGLCYGDKKIYVSDTNNSRIVVFNSDGNYLWSFSGPGSLHGQLNRPQGIAYGPDDKIFVADTGNSRIEVFNKDGIFLYGFNTLKSDGVSKIKPAKICTDISGNIYVSDTGSQIIQKLDRTGKILKEFGYASDGFYVDDYGFMYIINSKEGKIKELSAGGEIMGTFGTRGKGKTEFAKLADVTVDKKDNIYLCDEVNRKITLIRLENKLKTMKLSVLESFDRFALKGPVKTYNYKPESFIVLPDSSIVAYLPDSKELAIIDENGKKTIAGFGVLQGQVKQPMSIASTSDGNFFISDTGNNRVQMFDSKGAFVNLFGAKGPGEGKFNYPAGISFNAINERIYVADAKNKRIQAFNMDGIFLFAFGPQVGGVTLQNPSGLEVDASGNVYVLDSALKKVLVTDSSGKFLKIWADFPEFKNPAVLVSDRKGYFYILDRKTSNIRIFDADGKYVMSFFAKGTGERELNQPQDIKIIENKLYISDSGHSKILVFDLNYIPEAPSNITASVEGRGVKLQWDYKDKKRIKSYSVFRSTSEQENYVLIGSADSNSYADVSLTQNLTYYYCISGRSLSGETGSKACSRGVFLKGKEIEKTAEQDDGVSKNIAPMEIEPVELGYIFSANYKYYLKNPVGKIAVRNNTESAFSNVKLSFYLRDFMDFPYDTIINEISPMQKVEVDLMATLNNRILNITEDTPIQAQFSITYYEGGVEKSASINAPVKVLSKNAIVWDKPERIATFITPKDPPVFSFSRFALLEKSGHAKEGKFLNGNLMTGVMLWSALSEMGISYLPDPVNPYSVVKSSKEMVLDTVQFPRNTLKLKSGDCDDLTALVASLLENAGLHIALLDYPSHIALMFDTELSDAREVGIPEEYLIKHNNSLWIGIETTMLGKGLYDSIKQAADMYKKSEKEVRIVDVRNAWSKFEPVTLPDAEMDSYPDKEKMNKRAAEDVRIFSRARLEYLKNYFSAITLQSPDDVDANLNLGILYAQYNENSAAKKHFNTIIQKDPFNASALNNLGNISFNEGNFQQAKELYFKAAKADGYDANIWLNLARASVKLGKKEDVKDFVERAVKLDPNAKSIGDKLIK